MNHHSIDTSNITPRWACFCAILLIAPATPAQQVSWARQLNGPPPLLGFGGHSSWATASVARADGSCMVAGHFVGTVRLGEGEPNETVFTTVGVPTYVTGHVLGGFLAKYSPSGSLLWAKQIVSDFPAGYGDLSGLPPDNAINIIGLTERADGTFIMAGNHVGRTVFGPGESNETTLSLNYYVAPFLAAFGADGQLLWAKNDGAVYPQMEGVTSDGRAIVASISSGADGSIYVAGSVFGPFTFGAGEPNQVTITGTQAMFVAMYSPLGALIWCRSFVGGGSTATDLQLFADGSCLVTGSATSDGAQFPIAGVGEPGQTTLGDGPFLARFGPDGALAWVRQDVAVQAGSYVGETTLKVFADGSSVTCANFSGPVEFAAGQPNETTLNGAFNSVFVARRDAMGVLQWATTIGPFIVNGKPLALSATGEIDVITNDGGTGAVLTRLDGEGQVLWTMTLPAYGLISSLSAQFGPTLAPFPDGSTLLTLAGSGTMTIGAGQPNATELASPAASRAVFVRLRGETTQLASQTLPDGANPVTVAPTNAAEAGNSDVELTFSSVTAAGTTTAVVTNGAPTPPLPANFTLAGQPRWYEISTTATYTAPIEVCIDYDENGIVDESALRLMHYEGGNWVDITTTVDTGANRICGSPSRRPSITWPRTTSSTSS